MLLSFSCVHSVWAHFSEVAENTAGAGEAEPYPEILFKSRVKKAHKHKEAA